MIFTLTLCYILVHGKTIEGADNKLGQCKGLIRLISPCGLSLEYRKDRAHINFKAAKAVLEGCGCYRLHERKNYRGKTYHVNTIGEHKVPLKRVRSIAKVPCSSESMVSKDMLPHGSYVSVVFKRKNKKNRHIKKKKTNKKGTKIVHMSLPIHDYHA